MSVPAAGQVHRIRDENFHPPRFEFLLGTDNDWLIISSNADKYYSYGVETGVRFRSPLPVVFNTLNRGEKGVIQQISLKLEAFTPQYEDKEKKGEVSRPFAGWLYGEYQTYYFKRKSIWKLGMQAGILGPAVHAGDIQNWVHSKTGDPHVNGWSDQINNQLGVNLIATHSYLLATSNWWALHTSSSTSLGLINTFLQPGVNVRIGKFQPMDRSLSTGTALMNEHGKTEFFFEAGPALRMTLYDATIQGSLFGNEDFVNAGDINHFRLLAAMSLNFLAGRWSARLIYHYTAGELAGGTSHRFGTVLLNYRW